MFGPPRGRPDRPETAQERSDTTGKAALLECPERRQRPATICFKGTIEGSKPPRLVRVERKHAGLPQQPPQFVQTPQHAESLRHHRKERRLVAPRAPAEHLLRHHLSGAVTVIGRATAEAALGQVAVDRAAMSTIEIAAGRVSALVEAKRFGAIEGDGNAAQRCAALAIAAEERIGHGQVFF